MTFSHTAAPAGTVSTSNLSSTTPPVFSRSLWQVTQYRFRTARWSLATDLVEDCAAGLDVCAAFAITPLVLTQMMDADSVVAARTTRVGRCIESLRRARTNSIDYTRRTSAARPVQPHNTRSVCHTKMKESSLDREDFPSPNQFGEGPASWLFPWILA